MVAQKDSQPRCDRNPTNLWRPGELIVDVYDIPIAPDAPPGVYPLFSGLYAEDTAQRLTVLNEAGEPVSDRVQVGEIHVRGDS